MPAGSVATPPQFQAVVGDDHRSFRLAQVGRAPGHPDVANVSAVLTAIGALLVAGGVAVIVGGGSDAIVGVLWLPGGLVVAWLGIHLNIRPPTVFVTDDHLRCRDSLGYSWRVPRSEIAGVGIGARMLPKTGVAVRVPYLRKTDGTRLWLPPLAGGYVTRPTVPAQLDVVGALRTALQVGADDDGAASGTSVRPTWQRGPRASTTITALLLVLYLGAAWTLVTSTFIARGLHEDDLGTARGATVVTLRVDRTIADCSRGCSYTSVGSYRAPWSARMVSGARVVPSYGERRVGALRVVVSPGHEREALEAGYTGRGDIAAGIAIGAVASLVPVGVGAALVHRWRRRARVHTLVAGSEAGTAPTGRLRGILRGPGINPMIGVSRLEITPTEIVEVERIIGGDRRWTVPLSDVTDVEFDVDVIVGAAPSTSWTTTRFRTPQGRFTLTCDPAYVPLLRAALDRHPARS